MSYLKDREIWLSNVPTGNPPTGFFWKFIQNGKVVVRDSSGNNQIMVATSGSQAITGSLTVTEGITGTVSSASYVEYSNVANKPSLVSGSEQIAEFGYATTGSNGFNGSQSITGSLTVTGQVVAQTLNVQQVTSSVVFSSGSNIFGNELSNTQQFTGSVGVTGSLTVNGTSTIVGPLTGSNAIFTGTITNQQTNISADGAGVVLQGYVDNNLRIAVRGSGYNDGSRGGLLASTGDFSSTINGYFGNITTGQSPASSGTTPNNPMLNLTNNRGVGLFVGGQHASPFGTWIQVADTSNLGTYYPLLLQPNGGNVGIGTASPSARLHVLNSTGGDTSSNYVQVEGSIADNSNYPGIVLKGGTLATTYPTISLINGGLGLSLNGGFATAYNTPTQINLNNGVISFFTGNNASATERMQITSGGYLKASNTGDYVNLTGTYHELINSVTGSAIVYLYNTSANPYGPYVRFSGAAPNNGTNYFMYCDDNAVSPRFVVYSNGGISNYQANDTNLSDERTKKDIEPLESYWDKFKAIEIVKFKYKDQTHDDFNIGVIAQQVEAVAPEFVDVDGWDTKPKLDEEGNEIISTEEPLKSIYTADLHHATIKVLQEAMAKIEEQQTLIESLKSRVEILEQ